MSKRPSLAAAMQEANGKTLPEVKEAPSVDTQPSSAAPGVPPSRQGKKAITGHFDPAVSRQLRQLALDNGTTVQALLGEALNDLFVKHRRNPIA